MTSAAEIKPLIIKRYVKEAITHVGQGVEIIDKVLPMIVAGVGLHDKYRT